MLFRCEERRPIHHGANLGGAPPRRSFRERSDINPRRWPFGQLGLKDPSPLFFVREIEPNMQIETSLPDECPVQAIVEVCGGNEDKTRTFSGIVDTTHQPIRFQVERSSGSSRVIRFTKLLSFCTYCIDFVDEQQDGTLSLCRPEHSFQILLSLADIFVDQTRS